MASGASSSLWTLSPDQDLGLNSLGGSETGTESQGPLRIEIDAFFVGSRARRAPSPGGKLTRLYWGRLSPEDWLKNNLDWIRRSLRSYEAVHHPSVEIDEIKISIHPRYEMGNNYNPEMLRIHAVADVYSWNPESGNTFTNWEYHFIIKLLPSNLYFTTKKARGNCVQREKYMFENILPMFNDFMTDIDRPRSFVVPKLYISHFDRHRLLPRYVLGIDVDGYERSTVNRMLGLEQAKVAIQNLARLHGASYACNKKYNLVARYPVFNTTTFSIHWALMPGCFKNLIKFLRDVGGHEETVRLLVRGAAKALSDLKSRFQKQDDAALICLCHGDYRCTHLMFKEECAPPKEMSGPPKEESATPKEESATPKEESATPKEESVPPKEAGAPEDAILVTDWQQAMMMNPVYDVLFFLYTSTSKNLRKRHMKELLHLYYDSLASACYPEELPRYTFADFCKEVEEKSLFGFAMGICIAHFTLAKASLKMNWVNSVRDDLRKALGTPLFNKNAKAMKRVVMGLVSEAEENGNMKRFFYQDEGIKPPFSGRDIEKEWVQFAFDAYSQVDPQGIEYSVEDVQLHKGRSKNRGYDCEFADMAVTTRNYTYDPDRGIVTEVQEHHITNKTMPLNQTYNRYREINAAAKKESKMITYILPLLNKFLEKKGREKYCFQIPHIYFHEEKHMDYIVLMQDYKFTGFAAEDNLNALSLPQVKAAMAFLAKLHAVSHVYHRERDLTQEYPILETDEFEDFLVNIMSPSLDTVMLLLSRFLKSREIMLRNKKQALDKVKDMVEMMRESSFTCLCQGDFRTSNLLFRKDLKRKDHGLGNDVMVLDWQNITLKHPVYDVLMFLYTSTTPKFRKLHLDEVLEEYHRNLVTIITDLKVIGNFRYLERDHPYHEFRKRFMNARLFGFAVGLCLTQICDEYKPEVEEKVVTINRDPKVSKRLLRKFIRYNELFEEAERDGIFDGFYISVKLDDNYGDPSDIHLT